MALGIILAYYARQPSIVNHKRAKAKANINHYFQLSLNHILDLFVICSGQAKFSYTSLCTKLVNVIEFKKKKL